MNTTQTANAELENISGMSSGEAGERLSKFGPNQIFKPTRISFFGIAKHEVTEPMILLLLVVGFFYSIWGKLEDAITIFIVIVLLVLAEVYNEFRAKKAIASLGKIAAPRTKVLRDGMVTEIDSENVVPGDTLILTTGTRVAADAKIERSAGMQLDESALTGESFPQDKNTGDEIYAGTIVLSGEGLAQVFATGKNTGLGKIAAASRDIKPPKTSLQLAMKSLAGKLVFVALFFSIIIPVIGILKGQDIKTMILTGLSLSFATIPEELPIIITMVLGLGAYTLSKNNFLVKRIKAAETLGNATVIVTDKTGTITENRMKIISFYPENKEKGILEKSLGSLTEFSISPLERAIKNKTGELKIGKVLPRLIRIRDFGNGRKTKAVIRKNDLDYELFLSGAPEEIFISCSYISEDIKAALAGQTEKGRRVIAIAYKKLNFEEKDIDFDRLERGMEFAGLISFEDPPRRGVKETIAAAMRAGIRTIMVTGDHPLTARFIAREVGISTPDKVLTGEELDNLTDEELQKTVKESSVFARATPEHKYRIVKALQKNGEVVAVTGDGINDALALKGADIGIAMGIRGTDVAKEAAEVVVTDDNYVTIARGIFEGRKFFDNLQKGIKYYLSVKTALILIFLLPVLLDMPMPFAPIQIILLELFMDLAASVGFVAEAKEKNIYSRPPRNPKENIINNRVIKDLLTRGAFLFAGVILVYFYADSQGLSVRETQTYAFSAWIFGHITLAYISRSDNESIFSLGIFANRVINLWAVAAITFLILGIYVPFLNERFNLAPVGLMQLIFVALVMVFIIGLLEIKKVFGSGVLHK
ncbi:cation-translocating P-type ATPase [Candidatus Methanoperedens nitratireducens]|uniref:Putative cation-transporting ATPase n=1 Tax=Candidatus Methanoperedens nitratireducens TaxID=1392998 RepID=A0A284VM55_9EURY|nr:cation-transporting P-type ATPase [Candidatus Methanoperedens nitroreducens]SNQ60361.1 putative cation-transporting ATPase [Candidatus Methanoperedens nitroreducens]